MHPIYRSSLAALCTTVILTSCEKKGLIQSNSSKQDTSSANQMVVTPFGLKPKSQVFLIEPGYRILHTGGHVYKIKSDTREIVQDFGSDGISAKQPLRTTLSTATSMTSDLQPTNGPGYVAWVQWDNTSTTETLSNFTANWVVPNEPTTNDNQVVEIYLSEINEEDNVQWQATLQWGQTAAGGGAYWSVADWIIWPSGSAYTAASAAITPGTSLQPAIYLVGQNADSSFSYTCGFSGYGFPLYADEGATYTGSVIPFVPAPYGAYIGLWASSSGGAGGALPRATDYPAGQNYLTINNIVVDLNGSFGEAQWTPQTLTTNFGESALVLSNDVIVNTPPRLGQPGITEDIDGQVNLYFHPTPKINSDTILNLYTSPNTSVPFTITGFPGTQVQVIFTAPATTVALGPNRGATGTSTITASLTGATFTNGQSSVTVTDADVAYTLAIPAGGEVTGTAEFTYTGSVVAFTTIGVY